MASTIKEAHNNSSVFPALLSCHWSAFQTTDPGSVVSSHVFTSPRWLLYTELGNAESPPNSLTQHRWAFNGLPIASLLPSLSLQLVGNIPEIARLWVLFPRTYSTWNNLCSSWWLSTWGTATQFENHSPFIRTYPLGVPCRLFPSVFSTFVLSEECSFRTAVVTDLSLESSAWHDMW